MEKNTYSIYYINASTPARRCRFDNPRPLGSVVGGTQLLVLSRHQERRGYEIKVLQAAEVLHLLDVLEEFIFTR